jgi:photosystem II stability/assembly factor-like uncharacterized protein
MIILKPLMMSIALVHSALGAWELMPSGTTRQLRDVRFITSQKGFVVGDSGTFLRSVDSGKTWSQHMLDYLNGYRSISFSDTLRGVLGGTKGLILITENGGETWTQAQTPDTLTEVRDIFLFPGTSRGVATGGKGGNLRIWLTADGGNIWTIQDSTWPRSNADQGQRFIKTSPTGGEICFAGPDTGYVASGWAQGTSGLLRSLDGGLSWVDYLPPISEAKTFTFFVGCHFTSGKVGLFVGDYYGDISKTRNALLDSLSERQAGKFWDVYFPTSAIGYAVGSDITQSGLQGGIMKSTDGGETWARQVVPQSFRLYKVYFVNHNHGFAVGAGGTILRTTDGGGSPINVVPRQRGTSPARPQIKGAFGRFFDVLGRSMRSMRLTSSSEK